MHRPRSKNPHWREWNLVRQNRQNSLKQQGFSKVTGSDDEKEKGGKNSSHLVLPAMPMGSTSTPSGQANSFDIHNFLWKWIVCFEI